MTNASLCIFIFRIIAYLGIFFTAIPITFNTKNAIKNKILRSFDVLILLHICTTVICFFKLILYYFGNTNIQFLSGQWTTLN